MPMLTTCLMPLAAVSRTLSRIGQHAVEHLVHLVAEGPLPARRAQRGVQHRPAFGDVDRLAGEHGIAPGLQAAFARQLEQQAQREHVDAVLGQVGEHLGRLDAEAGKAAGVAREGLAQVEIAAMGLDSAPAGPPTRWSGRIVS